MSISPPPRRGEVVLVDYPFSSGGGVKRRPALVVQNDRDNVRLATTIIAMITSNTSRMHEATHLLIDVGTAEDRLSGLHHNSALVCTNLFTIEKTFVFQRIGTLPPGLMTRVDDCLRAAF